MSVDVSQFHQVFFEESFEWLDAMETALLELEEGVPDGESINTIFRAAHSIKGGAGTFGFIALSDFTHHLETLLDEIRNGRRTVTPDTRSICLESVDVLRDMLQSVQQGADVDNTRTTTVADQLRALLDGSVADSVPDTGAESRDPGGWRIRFVPHEGMLRTGNDPVRLLNELATLGELRVELDDGRLPPFETLDPESCYLQWDIRLFGSVPHAEVAEVFEWVEDDCDLSIVPIAADPSGSPPADLDPLALLDPGEPEQVVDPPSTATERSPGGRAAERQPASIRVNTDKVDSLINLVGELVITQSMLSQVGDDFDPARMPQLIDGLKQLERNTRELQEGVMRIRMIPISAAFRRLPRLVHDLGTKLDKRVALKLSGEQTELDKTVLEEIGDPLVHLVRNSLDHGLESPQVRADAGKPETGTLHLNAYHQSGHIVIDIEDDGAGLDEGRILRKAVESGLVADGAQLSSEKIHDLIFQPGFSTAETVSDISGRGVGMDVVKRNIQNLGGSIDVWSEPGRGTRFTIRLPLTLAIMDGQIIRVGGQRYIIPLISIVESVEVRASAVKRVADKGDVYKFRDEYIPLIKLHDLFDLEPEPDRERIGDGLLVVVESEKDKVGLLVDDLLSQQQIVIKSLETHYKNVLGLAGATILGDGRVALILDIAGLTALFRQSAGAGGRDFQVA